MRSNPRPEAATPALLVMAMVAALLPLGQAATAATNNALQFNGSTQYATRGPTPSYGAAVHAGTLVQANRYGNRHRRDWNRVGADCPQR